MAERTRVAALGGATISISAGIPDTYDQAGYESTDTPWTEIGEIEDFGAHGVKAGTITFTPVKTRVITKMKGPKDYGQKMLVVGYLPGDDGQALLKTASESDDPYSFKIAYDDGEVHYIEAIVNGFEFQDGRVDSVRRAGVQLDITRAPVIVLP